jgi:hypothetical protein
LAGDGLILAVSDVDGKVVDAHELAAAHAIAEQAVPTRVAFEDVVSAISAYPVPPDELLPVENVPGGLRAYGEFTRVTDRLIDDPTAHNFNPRDPENDKYGVERVTVAGTVKSRVVAIPSDPLHPGLGNHMTISVQEQGPIDVDRLHALTQHVYAGGDAEQEPYEFPHCSLFVFSGQRGTGVAAGDFVCCDLRWGIRDGASAVVRCYVTSTAVRLLRNYVRYV